MKANILSLLLLLLTIPAALKTQETAPTNAEATEIQEEGKNKEDPESIDRTELDQTLEEIDESVTDKSIILETELKSTLKRIERIVDTGMAAIDDETIRKYWREGKQVERDIEYERDVTFYEMRKVYDAPCKSVDFVFGVKEDYEEFSENADQYPLCFFMYFDIQIKEFVLDIVLKGVESILASGYSNPVSTFFSNAIIIEGPQHVKAELFGAIYHHFDTAPVKTEIFKELFEVLKKINFIDDGSGIHSFVKPENMLKADSLKRKKRDKSAEEHMEEHDLRDELMEEIEDFAVRQATPLTFLLYDMVTNTMHNNDVYLSAYDFIQPDVNLINEPESMDPGYVNQHYKEVLEKELEKFKMIRDHYHHKSTQTIYHQAYSHFLEKNITVLCKALYAVPEC